MISIPPTLDQVVALQKSMLEAVQVGAEATKNALPADVFVGLLRTCEALLRQEPTLVELEQLDASTQVMVFGDTHGHFPDVAYM